MQLGSVAGPGDGWGGRGQGQGCGCSWTGRLSTPRRTPGVSLLLLLPPDLFVGQLKSSLTCSECGYCSTAFDPFWDLSLPIPKVMPAASCPRPAPVLPAPGTFSLCLLSSQKGYGEVTLMDCLRLFTKEDVLDGDEKPVRGTGTGGRYMGRAERTDGTH